MHTQPHPAHVCPRPAAADAQLEVLEAGALGEALSWPERVADLDTPWDVACRIHIRTPKANFSPLCRRFGAGLGIPKGRRDVYGWCPDADAPRFDAGQRR
jgi:hypothetical protein